MTYHHEIPDNGLQVGVSVRRPLIMTSTNNPENANISKVELQKDRTEI